MKTAEEILDTIAPNIQHQLHTGDYLMIIEAMMHYAEQAIDECVGGVESHKKDNDFIVKLLKQSILSVKSKLK